MGHLGLLGVGILTGVLITILFNRILAIELENLTRDITPPVGMKPEIEYKTKPGHIKPDKHELKGRFSLITKCTGCGVIGSYQNRPPKQLCKDCGSTVNPAGLTEWAISEKGEGFWKRPNEDFE